MKKILLSAAFGAISLGAFAQVADLPTIELPKRNVSCLPARFTKDNHSFLISANNYDDLSEMVIYDANLNVVKSISHSLTSYYEGVVTYERELITDANGNIVSGGEWKEVYSDLWPRQDYIERCYMYLCDGQTWDDTGLPITQTLFNNDEKHEYIVPIIKVVTRTKEEDPYGVGVTTLKTVTHSPTTVGYKIMSEDNTEITRITHELDEEKSESINLDGVVLIDNKSYLMLNVMGSDRYQAYLYAIDKGTSSISEAPVRMAMSVRPTVAKKNEVINVTLPEDSKASQLLVTSAAGQTIQRIPLKAGVSSYQVRTTGLASGMYVISVDEGGNKKEYCKVVIR